MSREAMQMALEALELYQSKSSVQMFDEAVKALRQALEEEREPLYWSVSTGWVYANDTSQERVDESVKTEHEPVAWADKVGAVIPHSHKLFQPDLFKDYTRPLYTAPAKREWVGLNHFDRTLLRTTHAPLKPIYHDKDNSVCAEVVNNWDVFFDAIEAKLKEKNHG